MMMREKFEAHLMRAKEQGVVLDVVDCHAGGEPARVVVCGVPDIAGATMLEKRAALIKDHDWLRLLLLQEPRGYPCQNVNFVFQTEEGFGFVIGEQNKIYPLMSGHNAICVVTTLIELGLISAERFKLEAPVGMIDVEARFSGGRCESVALTNAPCFVDRLDAVVQVPELGKVTLDVAFGGMWYAVVDLRKQFGHLRVAPEHAAELCRIGEMIKVAAREQLRVKHPTIDYEGPDILVFTEEEAGTNRNAVVMSNGQLDWTKPETWTGMLDRSACGTGTCAVMAVRHARGRLKLGENFVHESILGTTFTGTLLSETMVGDRKALVPRIEGSAWITQLSRVVLHPTDPFPTGFTLGDIWA